ncbi:MAG TPA: L,D-transpeptidase [Prolixibacteraceae bacterium]|nr:L,D-transpeptidase [Prolixibacteraceae bacterium]
MKKLYPVLIVFTVWLAAVSCNQKTKLPAPVLNTDLQGTINRLHHASFDSIAVDSFFVKFPLLNGYRGNIVKIYQEQRYHHIWFDENGVVEFANSLFSKVKGIASEGVYHTFPYMNEIDDIFESDMENKLSQAETEIMITNMFLFYAEKVYRGVDDKTVAALEWLLPKKQVSYENVLDSMFINTDLLARNDSVLFSQYYKLRDVLKHYREIQKSGGWDTISIDPKIKAYKLGDTAIAIVQIRERLSKTGDIAQNSGSNKFDEELLIGVNKYQLRNGRKETKTITPQLIKLMNVPVSEHIKKIVVNMERWRWVSPDFANASEYIFVNIPSYTMFFNRDGQRVYESPVVVGKSMSKTVVFSGNMSFVVFSPYWNVPPSILESEILPGIKKDKNYLAKHNMEWNEGQVRQKPGRSNSLGKVKFIFPNSNNIYLHDSPVKNLYGKDNRAFSHGCVRVGKPRDLAIEVLKSDPDWTPEKIDAAMNAKTEKWVSLKKKIPVHIGYFTAWVNDLGEFYFYEDIYKRDDRLYDVLLGFEDSTEE